LFVCAPLGAPQKKKLHSQCEPDFWRECSRAMAERERSTNPDNTPLVSRRVPSDASVAAQRQAHRAAWHAQLQQFMRDSGSPIERLPIFDREQLDMYALYYAVTQVRACALLRVADCVDASAQRGGLETVTRWKLWRQVTQDLSVDPERTDAGAHRASAVVCRRSSSCGSPRPVSLLGALAFADCCTLLISVVCLRCLQGSDCECITPSTFIRLNKNFSDLPMAGT
jgi:hypothetical protein